MTRVKKCRIVLCAVFAAVFSAAIAFAFVPRSGVAHADEEIVLGENTASYTFENDEAFPWTWEKTTNTWTRHNSGSRDEMTRHSKLTLKVTSDGDVAFKYMIHSKNEEGDYLKVSKNGEDLNTTDYTAAEYAEVKMTELKTDDTLTFEFYLSSYKGGFDYYVSIGGLDNASLLSQTYEVKATAEGDGTVAVGDEAYQAEATKQVPFGESVVLKAKANDGKTFFGWKKGSEYVSTSEQLTVDVDSIMAAQEYTAVFVDPTYQQESMSGWTGNREKYTASVAKAAENTLTIEFVDEQYITFDFKFNFVKKSGLTFEITIDGKTAYEAKSASTITTQMEYSEVLHVAGGGRHVAVFSLTIGSYTTPPSGASATLENLAFKKSVAMQNITLDWEERLGDVWIVEGYNETSDYFIKTNGHQVTEKTLNLPVGMTVSFYAFPKDEVQSTVTSGNTHGVFAGYYNEKDSLTDAKTYSGKVGTDVFSAGKTLEIRFLEYVPAPEIELTKTVGNDQERGISVQNGSVIDVPDGGNNNLVFQVSKYKTKVEKLTATVGGEDVPITEENQTDQYFGLVLNNVTERSEIVITLDYGDGYYADPITLQLNITTPKGLQDVVFEGAQVTAESGENYPWFYDADMSSDLGIVYTSGLSYGAVAIQGTDHGTYLKFTVEGRGSFSFDFYLDGWNYNGGHTSWAGYLLNDVPTNTYGEEGKFAVYSSSTGFENRQGYGISSPNVHNLAYGNNDNADGSVHADSVIYAGEGGTGTAVVSRIQDGQNWFSCTIPIDSEDQTVIYVLHGLTNTTKQYPTVTQMSVRNVKFFSGSKKVEWGVQDGSGADATGNGTITATVDGKAQTSGAQEGIPAGSLIKFTAKPEAGKQLYAWVDGNGKVLSYEDEFTYPLAGEDTKIYAVIDDKDNFAARIDGKLYETLDAAATAAQDGDKIILLKSTETSASFEIKKGVSLILPIDGRETYYELGRYDANHPTSPDNTASPDISWALGSKFATPVITLTVNDGAVITVKGSLYVGGVLHCQDQSAQGHTSGKYTQLILDGSITVEEGGLMDVYGRVTGKGGITVKSGGVLYQPFLILDYAGGTNTEGLFNLNQTPFKRYAMINIQCEKGYTIEYGGELYGHASLYFLSSVTTLDTQFISYIGSVNVGEKPKNGTTTLINLKEGAKVTGVYKDEKFVTSTGGNTANIGHTTLTVTGGATAGYMDFLGLVQTDNVAFSIPYNYEIVLNADEKGNGTYDMSYDYKLMPGASLTVGKGATLNLNAKFYVYDGLVQSKMSTKGYPTAAELSANNYYPTNGNFIVNGTLNINQGATFLGVIQTTDTTGAATIVVAKDGEEAQGTKVTLEGKIVDGGTTSYDCNYSEYASSARIWDKVHNTLVTLETGKTYVSTYASGDTFDLPAVSVTYEKNNYGNTNDMKGHGDHTDNANYATGTLDAVEGLKGAWKLQHTDAEHVYDWTPKGDETSFDGNSKETTRGCTLPGCDHQVTATLLKDVGTFESEEYSGTAFEAKALFDKLYGAGSADKLHAEFSVDKSLALRDAQTYTITVTVPEEYGYFVAGGAFKDEASFSFTISRKKIQVTIEDQTQTYSGSEPAVSQTEFTAAPEVCEGDVLGFTITKEEGKDYRDGGYRLTAAEDPAPRYANHNYEIEILYTQGDHSVFTVAKKQLTVTPKDLRSHEGDDLVPFEVEVTGYVEGEESLHLLDPDQFRYTCEASPDKTQGSYPIDVTYEGEVPNNYSLHYEQGHYTITESVYDGVSFANVTVDYDGEPHSLQVKGLDSLSTPSVQYDHDESYLTQTDAGVYTVTVTIVSGDSHELKLTATLTIRQRDVHITLLPQSKTYDGQEGKLENGKDVGWEFAQDSKLYGKDGVDALGIVLSITGNNKNADGYPIHAEVKKDGNYNVIVDNNNAELYTIRPKDVYVTVTDVTTTYGDPIDRDLNLNQGGWTLNEGSELVSGEQIYLTLSTDVRQAKGTYDITGTEDASQRSNDNYTIHITNGKWTVNAKSLTVVVEKVTVVYSGEEPAKPTEWEFKTGSALAPGDTRDMLHIDLTKDPGAGAGTYDIQADYDNDNYVIEFEGLKGGYVIEQRDITKEGGTLFITVDGHSPVGDKITVTFAGTALEVIGFASFTVGGEPVSLETTLSAESISGLGEYTVTVSVDDPNYCGTAQFHVSVISEAGYTKRLIETLAQLAELVGDKTEQTLTVDDFGMIKQISALLDGLDETEQQTAAEELAFYRRLVDAWDEAADIDEIVETAEQVADSFLNGLVGAAATVSILAALAFVVGKGGIL